MKVKFGATKVTGTMLYPEFHFQQIFEYVFKKVCTNFGLYCVFQHPVSWVPNADGTRLVGHMVLHKSLKDNLSSGGASSSSSATILGLKVVGGKILPNGRYGAIIEKVKKGSVADTVGHLLPGNILNDMVQK